MTPERAGTHYVMIVETVLNLPYSTAETEDGPVIEQRPGKVNVRYDAEDESGIVWTSISFRGAIATRFTPEPACEPWMIEAYSRVCIAEESPWLNELRRLALEGGEPIADDRRHWIVYFDHYGCLEVVAEDVRLDAA